MIAGIVIGVIAGLLIIGLIITYNGLVRLRNQMRNAWSQIDVQLKRRHDLIPNLVETVKGYASHERQTFEEVTNARNLAQGAVGKGVDAQSRAEGELSGALSRLLAVAENYPDLKANQNFLALQEELTSTENKIAFSRQFFNDSVLSYNNKIQMFPSNIIAGIFNFKAGDFFEVETPTERAVPQVNFS
ncbi:MAG: LemA family protein [Dehalococcoidia bacterium]